jgi:hypothetical protein
MKATATHKLVRLAVTVTPLISLAALNGRFMSDEQLKQEIATVESPLELLRKL